MRPAMGSRRAVVVFDLPTTGRSAALPPRPPLSTDLPDANAAAGLMNEISELQAEVERLRGDKKKLEQNLTEVTEDKCLAEYKNQVLLEMVRRSVGRLRVCGCVAEGADRALLPSPPQLAVAQLDAETANGELKKEQLKCDALKWEVSKLSLERVG